ncbi:putative amidophosphoribosyltransferase [Rivularia sp. PCC 7116]|uniref:ComF family protein n=1 Tax=Rivularia sp. PCC 7116 TaxID=373994 RepID=UPI00029EEA7B|nr:ComF family protein [Rivularia sp. PCC 7116]AFY56734.1 putative amidophosphoribosyltransferase [Rivularia sp. PCC 7116]
MQIWKSFLNLFLQSNCPLCKRPASQEFCEYCEKQLQKCRLTSPNQRKDNSLPIIAWGAYGGAIKRAITTMKYDNHPEIARPLGEWLGEAWLQEYGNENSFIVVPIPMHPDKQEKRGFNQAALIAKSFCQTTGLKLKLNGLKRIKETEALFGLSATERKQNLNQAFDIGKDFRQLPNVPVILVDDIYTTGATVKSAIETLNKYKIIVSGVAAVAVPSKGNYKNNS